MKYTILFLVIITLFSSCKNSGEKKDSDGITVSTKDFKSDNKGVEVVEANVIHTGEYIELFPNGKVQTEGWNNKQGLRDGIWYSYYETGTKWSESSYKNGIKEGHSIVFFPTGKIRYMGDYKNDEKSGHWIFYNEAGEIDTEKDY
jgi:antitoxin component YwqK of YwqJK toxin-antitoxin module